ncbi:hypothetical protein M569_08362 [Genlisea aurea]|uniref:C2 domain-containing protein n=1 Tax=Genlisea aurea TaxID=192259 RepID=S8CI86_9LAMI|nr:hypothetical protein M569_08362 [Genlisea aurea]
MDSPPSVVSSSVVLHESNRKEAANFFDVRRKNGARDDASDEFLGAVEVFIHQARDIHNICIYQKQDVYAKLCLTSDPERAVSTKIINGGGRNPVFNENLSLAVRTVDSSLKCEIWMLSRVRNYLEDQLLGFALVPVSEILLHDGKLEKEFSLTSTDLFHSPAGFVELTVLYAGVQPEVIPIPLPEASHPQSMEESSPSLPSALDAIEFPDPPQVVNETNKMVEEYFAMPCDAAILPAIDSPPPPPTTIASAATIDGQEEDEPVSPSKNGSESDGGSDPKPVVTVEVEPEQQQKVVQQDIVDMYMKSMQQFTESLAKMKLPLDMESGPTSTESSSTTPSSKSSAGSRVFYGSRAFF